jgi:redox-sensitive bicupin YhaK (pirin superfamily)
MIKIRKSNERGYFDHGWLKSHHSFSFGDFFDPEHMGFRALRVINEDVIQGGQGFGTHPHRDMEILTYVISGKLAHQDSMGNGSEILPGEVQYMSAGSGVTHSEFNGSKTEPCHLLQIWILSNERAAKPRYDQKKLAPPSNALRLAASPDGAEGSIAIRQDARLSIGRLSEGKELKLDLPPGRHAWIQMIAGQLEVGSQLLQAGGAAAVSDSRHVPLKGLSADTHFLYFELS